MSFSNDPENCLQNDRPALKLQSYRIHDSFRKKGAAHVCSNEQIQIKTQLRYVSSSSFGNKLKFRCTSKKTVDIDN